MKIMPKRKNCEMCGKEPKASARSLYGRNCAVLRRAQATARCRTRSALGNPGLVVWRGTRLTGWAKKDPTAAIAQLKQKNNVPAWVHKKLNQLVGK